MRIAAVSYFLGLFFIAASLGESFQGTAWGQTELDSKPLSRVREGGTPYNPLQSLHPYAVQRKIDGPIKSGVASPPEYDPVRGVLFKWASNSWPTVVTAMVAALTGNPNHDEIAYVVVANASQQTSATNAFIAAGADMSKVEFMIHPSNSVWMRDYGPHFVWLNDTLTIADSHYYPNRPADNFVPTLVGEDSFGFYTAHMGLYYSGGNFLPGPNRSGFVTSLVNLDNPPSQGFDEDLVRELYEHYQGVDTLHILPQLPFSVDGTGHIDMWFYLVDEDTVIISEFLPGSNNTAINITNNAVTYMESLGYEVFRPRAWNSGGTHYTYANSYRVNNRLFVPVYGTAIVPGGNSAYNANDAHAMAVWQAAVGPEIELIPIQCISIIPAAGAIHCIVKQVPRYMEPMPAANVISPAGGDIMISDAVETISWSATDTNNVEIPQVDLYYSRNDGLTWNYIATSANTGSYEWLVPQRNSDNVRIRVDAIAADSDVATFVSEPFRILNGTEITYDFATNAGVDRWGKGSQTSSWATIDGNPNAVISFLTKANYASLAFSDAFGGTSDPNRYIAPIPSSGWESTHIFEFLISEPVQEIGEIVCRWEGYAANCTQVEMYVWDFVANQWCDGKGLYGQNRFMDNFAGNRDKTLTGTLRSDLSRYVGIDGMVRMLIYSERAPYRTYHDYLSLTVKKPAPIPTVIGVEVIGSK